MLDTFTTVTLANAEMPEKLTLTESLPVDVVLTVLNNPPVVTLPEVAPPTTEYVVRGSVVRTTLEPSLYSTVTVIWDEGWYDSGAYVAASEGVVMVGYENEKDRLTGVGRVVYRYPSPPGNRSVPELSDR